MPASLADVWRLYVKPSMKGAVIIRKKTVIRRSAKVLERNRDFATKKIASEAKSKCIEDAKNPDKNLSYCIYIGKDKKEHCRWECFIRYLREVAREKLSKKSTGGSAGGTSKYYVTW